MSRHPWWTRACWTARASTSSFRRWPSTGPLLSIRRFGTTPLTADDLLRYRALTPQMLETAAQGRCSARLNIVVSGGTGSGKTTLLNVLSGFISDARAHRHHRGLGGTAAEAGARGRGWSAARPTWKARAPSASASW